MTTLTISFSGLLSAASHGQITLNGVKDGLFYFGCTRSRVFEYDETGGNELDYTFRDNPEQGRGVLQELQQILLQAEAEGRVAWREVGDRNSYQQLNQLLVNNGFRSIPIALIEDGYGYNLPAVERAVEEAGIPLRVIS